MDKRIPFIDTVAREDIICGLEKITKQAAEKFKDIDVESIMDESEQLRDF